MNDNISDALNLEPIRPNLPAIIEPPSDVTKDFDYARDNLYQAIETCNHALTELVQIAAASQHPRAFEVLANMIKTQADINGQLLDLQLKRKDMETPEQKTEDNRTQNLIVTTADLAKLIKDLSNGG